MPIVCTGLAQGPTPLSFILKLLGLSNNITAGLWRSTGGGSCQVRQVMRQLMDVLRKHLLKCVIQSDSRMKRTGGVIFYLQQEPDSCPQSWNKQGTQPRQPASARLLSDDARSRADRALVIAASRTTVPRSDRAVRDNRKEEQRNLKYL